MKIILYSQTIRKTSGLRVWERNFIKSLHKEHEILYVYEIIDEDAVKEMSSYVQLVKNQNQVIEGDICIYSTVAHSRNKISVKKSIQILHSIPDKWGVYIPIEQNVTYVAVSESVQQSLKQHYGIDSIIIPNLLADKPKEIKEPLRLLTASRIAKGKGFERMKILAEAFQANQIPFVWEVYGDGTLEYRTFVKQLFKDIPEIVLMGHRENILNYMKGADYVVQLSDSEGFCYSIFEALQIGVPVIATEFNSSIKEVIGKNGYVLSPEMRDYDPVEIYEKRPISVVLEYESPIQLWRDILK